MRATFLPLLFTAAALSGCGATARFTRPDGDGGWSAERRAEEVDRAVRAGDAEPPPPIEGPPHDPGAPLTLREALRLAASNNRILAESRLQLDVERERVAEVRDRLLPTAIGSGRYTWYSDAQTTDVDLPSGLLPPGTVPPEVEVRDNEAGVLNGTLTQPIDLTGELRYALAAAQAGFRGEAARNWATRLEQHARTIEAYFQLLEAERLREVTRQTIELHQEQLANAKERYDNGRLTKNELLVVQVALTDSQQLLVRSDLSVDRARWALNQVLGLAVAAPTEAEDVHHRPDVPSAEEAIADARRRNPILVSLLEEQQRLEATITSLERSRLPRFNAGGAIDYSSSDILQPQDIASGFVGFIWDLGTDGQREARLAAARRSAEVNEVRVERQVRELEEAVRHAQRAVIERLSAFDSATSAVGQAEENLRIRRQQFDAGRATSEDVLDAQQLLTRQRAVAATALYEAHSRRARLQQLMGEPMEELVANQESL